MSSEIITKNDLKAILDTALPTQPVLVDSGWKTATLSSAFSLYTANEPVQYRRVGKLVEIRGTIKPTAEIAGSDTWYTIFTLPLGYRPSENRIVLQQGSGTSIWLSSVDASGNVGFARYRSGASYAAAPTSVWLNLHLDFLIDADDWPVTPVTCADYIVEQGTDGDWTYRKWNSGVAECWYEDTIESYAMTTAVGSFYTGAWQELTFPFTINSATIISTCLINTDSNMGFTHTRSLTSSSVKVRVAVVTSATLTVKFYIYIKGRWK